MPIISIQSDYVRSLGGEFRAFERVTIELKQIIQYRLLGEPRYRVLLGPSVYELEQLVQRLNQEEYELGAQVRQLLGLADQVDTLNGGGYTRPSWFSPGFFGATGIALATSAFLPRFYTSRTSLFNISRVVYRGYGGGYFGGGYADPVNTLAAQGTYVNVGDTTNLGDAGVAAVNALASQGTYVNVAESGVDPSVQALRDMLRGYGGAA